MNKNGFTLAEILVTLGIVGVLAAMTIPTLVNDNQNQVFGNSLSVAVSDFENAMSAMITQENVSSLEETEAWVSLDGNLLEGAAYSEEDEKISDLLEGSADRIESFVSNISRVFNTTEYNTSTDGYYVDEINQVGSSTKFRPSKAFGSTITIVSKKGVAYHIRTVNMSTDATEDIDALNNGVSLARHAAFVFIDVNEKNKPNRIGRDIYGFLLGNDGKLYPLGGKDATFKLEEDTEAQEATPEKPAVEAVDKMTKTWDSSNSTYACTNLEKKSYALGCTGRLVDNNYKIDY